MKKVFRPKKRRYRGTGENCSVMVFMICNCHKILFGL